MGPRATRFALVFWMALAVAVVILAIKPWAGARDSQEQAGSAHSGAGNHLSAATLESVLKTGRSSAETQAFPTSA
jgi:hypothetical protein